MKPILTITGPAAVLPRANIDTDQIIPARFMSRSRADGYGEQCFHDLRYSEDGAPRTDWPLAALPEGPAVLVTEENFGCGSSREAAVYALMDYGVKVIIAPSFGDIFRSNAGKNGLLAITLPRPEFEDISVMLRSAPGMDMSVDLPDQRLSAGAFVTGFDIESRLKYRLERGLDDLSATLELESRIAAFEAEHLGPGSWRIPGKSGTAQAV